MFDMIYCALIKFVNLLIFFLVDWWVELIIWILELLPDADFSAKPIEWGTFGNSIGYFFPVASMVSHFTLIMGAYAIFISVRHVLKLIKMIG